MRGRRLESRRRSGDGSSSEGEEEEEESRRRRRRVEGEAGRENRVKLKAFSAD